MTLVMSLTIACRDLNSSPPTPTQLSQYSQFLGPYHPDYIIQEFNTPNNARAVYIVHGFADEDSAYYIKFVTSAIVTKKNWNI